MTFGIVPGADFVLFAPGRCDVAGLFVLVEDADMAAYDRRADGVAAPVAGTCAAPALVSLPPAKTEPPVPAVLAGPPATDNDATLSLVLTLS
jgi:hypothetical protein